MSEPSARLVRKIHELFGTSADPFGSEVSERVQAATIKASDGDWPDRLDDYLSRAR